jgi:uncharacterized protein DUF3592
MEVQTVISRVGFLWLKSLGPWLSVWAIRYKADCDYRLSRTAKGVRWLLVAIGYVLAASLPGPGFVRVIPGLTGMCFLCWPNLAYHFTNFLVDWPKTQGRVTSFAQFDSHPVVGYTFEFGGNMYGGTTALKSNGHTHRYSEGQDVTVAYDPLNPDESRAVP